MARGNKHRRETPKLQNKTAQSPKPGDVPPTKVHPNRLREIRLKGVTLSQDQVALLMGCDSTTVSRDESGDRSISRERLVAYAQLYRCQTYEIFMEPAPSEESHEAKS